MSEILQLSNDALLNKTRQVAERVREAGGRALLVGGYVRDALLNLSPKDADLEVYGLEAEVLRKVLQRCGRVGCVGESFRVYKLSWHENDERFELDVSLPRRDKKVGQGHRGFEVEGDPHASFEDAARRRDFTVNAIMCDPLTGEIIDPFGGRADLNKRVLKMVDAEHFAEDSLRVLRACQFAARFEMIVDEATAELCRQIDLSDLPRERIWGEWEKLLLKAEKPSIGLRVAYELKVLAKLFFWCAGAFEDAAAKMCDVLDSAAQLRKGLAYEKQVTLMLAALGSCIHDWTDTCVLPGAPITVCEEIERPTLGETLLDSLGIYKMNGYDVRSQIYALEGNCKRIPYMMHPSETVQRLMQSGVMPIQLNDAFVRHLSVECDLQLLSLLMHSRGDEDSAQWLTLKIGELGLENGPPAPLLLGRHLLEMGSKPGPRIGEITRAAYEKQLNGDVSTLEEAKEVAQKLICELEA